MSYTKAQDLLALANYLARHTGASLDDIEETFACGRRRAQRMIAALQDLFPQLERVVDDERRARWRLPSLSIAPLLKVSSDELAALTHAIEILKHDGATSEARNLAQLENTVRAAIPDSLRTRLDVDEEALLESHGLAARPGPRPSGNKAVDELIAHSLKARQTLRILYASRGEDARWRLIEPHGLLLGIRRYLVAIDSEKPGVLRHYRVEEIEDAEPTNCFFQPDPSFDLQAHARRGFGSFERESEYGEVVWRFKPEAAEHARRYLFHPDQTQVTDDEGALIVRFRASGHLEMAWHLYTWGDTVEVLEPEALRKLIAGHQRADFSALP